MQPLKGITVVSLEQGTSMTSPLVRALAYFAGDAARLLSADGN